MRGAPSLFVSLVTDIQRVGLLWPHTRLLLSAQTVLFLAGIPVILKGHIFCFNTSTATAVEVERIKVPSTVTDRETCET